MIASLLLYQSRMKSKARANFVALKLADLLAEVTPHILDGSFHLVRYDGWYCPQGRFPIFLVSARCSDLA